MLTTQPFLETERLIIRRWQPEQDAHQAFAIYNDAEVTQWLSNRSVAETVADVKERLQRYVERFYERDRNFGCWAVVDKACQDIIGNLLLIPLPDANHEPTEDYEIGWHFRRQSWGRGFATESARCLMYHGFQQLHLPALHAVTKPNNLRSVGVMERLGMQRAGLTRQYYGGHELLLYRADPTLISTESPRSDMA